MVRYQGKDAEHVHAQVCSGEDKFHGPRVVLVEAQAAQQGTIGWRGRQLLETQLESIKKKKEE